MGAHESSPRVKEVNIELGEECSRNSNVCKLWTRVQACTRNGTKGTLFVKELTSCADSRQYFENGIKSLRQLRHPCILQYVDSQFISGEARLFTERVQVLDLCIHSLSSIEIRSGLRSILDALIFLHTTASMSHNAVCPSSIFVSPDGSFRLGGFEFARKYGGDKKDDHLLLSDFFKAVKPKPFSPPEDQTAMRSDNPPWARDSFGLGRLVEYVLPYVEKEGGEEYVLSALRSSISSLCADIASERTRLEESTEMETFLNPLSEVEQFVRTIQTKNEEEKDKFFDECLSLLCSLPPRVIGKRLARPLLSRYVILEERAHNTILAPLLHPILPSSCPSLPSSSGLLPLHLYQETVLPEVTHVLRVRDLNVRLAILRHVHRFAPHYTREQLINTILPEILIGLDDPDDRIVAATLKSMSILVPLVGADAVLGRQKSSETTPSSGRRAGHHDRAKIFVDGTPKAASSIDSIMSPTVCSPVHSRPVSPNGEVEMIEKIAIIDTAYQMQNIPEMSMNEWHEDDEGWNEEWEENVEIKDQSDEKDEKKNDTRIVTVMKNTVERTTMSTKKEDFGSEFALKVTVKDEIDDLFAEMQPEIKSCGSILSQLEDIAVKSTRSTVSPSNTTKEEEDKRDTVVPTRLAFTTSDESGSGWDREGEWGLDED